MVEIVPYPIRLSWEGDAAVAGGDKMATGGEFFFFFSYWRWNFLQGYHVFSLLIFAQVRGGRAVYCLPRDVFVDGAGTCRSISSMIVVCCGRVVPRVCLDAGVVLRGFADGCRRALARA